MDMSARGIMTAVATGGVDGADAATGAAPVTTAAAHSPQATSTLDLALITTPKTNAFAC
jgi:hypothetical protein